MESKYKRGAAVLLGGFVLALVLLAPPSTQGDDWNLATRFTINHQFEVPGAVLEANTPYVIRLYNSPSERNVVQILNEDETQLLTMFMAINDERMDPTDDTKFTFMESAPGFPLPIKEWFYPGRLGGREFIYPKDQLERIATYRTRPATTQVAAAVPEPVVEPQAEPVVEQPVETAAVVEPANTEPVPAESEIVQIAQADLSQEAVSARPSEEPAVSQNETPTELPRTAGELPLIGLIGLLCLGASFGLKVIKTNN